MESELRWRSGAYIVSGLVLFVIGGLAGLVFLMLNDPGATNASAGNPILTETFEALIAQPNDQPFSTNTPRPPVQLATVTDAPPTVTPTPTEGPCLIEVQPGSTLYAIMALCGHRDFDVMDEVLEINELDSGTSLQIGEVIEVPRPTPTVDPNAQPEEGDGSNEDSAEGEAQGGSSFASVLFADGADGLPTFTPSPSPTLPPGIQWHTVQQDENIIVIAYQYSGGVEVLSQLNPEIEFNQCDFGEFTGGPDCNVFLSAGQQIRVPAPTPTPTLSPTPSGSETATPTATATFNAPNLSSPGDRALFRRTELVTLRWAGTGTLSENEVYRVRVQNLETGTTFTKDVRESFFIIPAEWQERDGARHDYQWRISVVDLNTPEAPIYVTDTRTFTWEATAPDPETTE